MKCLEMDIPAKGMATLDYIQAIAVLDNPV